MLDDSRALVVPDGTEVIKGWQYEKADYECVFVLKSVEEIQSSAFRGCENLKEFVFEAGSVLKKIDDRAFCGCTNLKNIQFSDGLEEIGRECFRNSYLEAIVLPASVKSIGPYTFYNCK